MENELKKIKVLIIDDEETLLEFISKRLKRKGFTVKTANSGEKAIEVIGGEPFDVAVVDLKMPGIDGVETQRRLHKVQPLLQCIVLTGHSSIESALESGQEKAFRYLVKPLDYDQLVETIQRAYEKKVKLQNVEFREKVEALQRSGLGAKGIKKEIAKLRQLYGIE